ncbi:flagellar hook-length control protein FliK [Shewanella sp. FJAT-52076]|uniref:flagellar hook-length control protein FliK n=1 Tax=Shewanella sp. FJAT-52076 TaxID=2864202 RepID=UPI001C660BA0|nr:flagellar hook-length control protein FliK [Shewanella sp. FJAT-52076]QYJ74087.1 flagellar hook-length control protein FliK [Shewanella sp. FJAT-52076]
MQQILNVLLGSAGAATGPANPESSGTSAEGVDFDSIISKTVAYEESSAKSLQVKGSKSDNAADAVSKAEGGEVNGDAHGDGVSSVLAQIQFSRQFAADKTAVKGGEALPPEAAASEIPVAMVDVIDDASVEIAADALFLRFSALMKQADEWEREQIASELGMSLSALMALDESAFNTLMADNPTLKEGLALLLQADASGADTDNDAGNQVALLMQTLLGTPAQPNVSAENPSEHAADVRQGVSSAEAALNKAANLAPDQARGLDVAMSRVGGDPELDNAFSAGKTMAGSAEVASSEAVTIETFRAETDGKKGDAGQAFTRALGAAQGLATDPVAGKEQGDLGNKGVSGITPLAGADASTKVSGEPQDTVNEALSFKSVEAASRAADNNLKPELPAMDTKGQASIESVADIKQPSQQHSSRIHETPAMTMSLRTAQERPMTQPDMVARFAPVMHTQLIAMVRDGIQQAEIRLDPPELGSMMVRIQVQGNETQVQFHVNAQQTKDVVEQAMPRLRELLAQQGMELTDGQVSHERRGDGRERQDAPEGSQFVTMDEFPAEELQLSANQTTSYSSGIDYYA